MSGSERRNLNAAWVCSKMEVNLESIKKLQKEDQQKEDQQKREDHQKKEE